MHYSFHQRALRQREHAMARYASVVRHAHASSPPGYLPLAYENDAALSMALRMPTEFAFSEFADTSSSLPSLPEFLRDSLSGTFAETDDELASQLALARDRSLVTRATETRRTGSSAKSEDRGEGPSRVRSGVETDMAVD